jgi:hypothetical protein
LQLISDFWTFHPVPTPLMCGFSTYSSDFSI